MHRLARWIFVHAGESIITKRNEAIITSFNDLFPDSVVPANRLDEEHSDVKSLLERVRQDVKKLLDPLDASAESDEATQESVWQEALNGISFEFRSLLLMDILQKDRLFIISSDTVAEYFYALATLRICKSLFGWNRSELIVIKGLQSFDYHMLRDEGIPNLTKMIDRKIRHAQQTSEVFFNITCCMHQLLPLYALLGVLFRAHLVEFDLLGQRNVLIPCLPFEFSTRWYQNPYYQILLGAADTGKRVTKSQMIQRGVAELLPLFEEEGKELRLSPLGRMITEVIRIKTHKEDWRERF